MMRKNYYILHAEIQKSEEIQNNIYFNIVSTYDMDFIPKFDHKYLQFKVINQ